MEIKIGNEGFRIAVSGRKNVIDFSMCNKEQTNALYAAASPQQVRELIDALSQALASGEN